MALLPMAAGIILIVGRPDLWWFGLLLCLVPVVYDP